MFGRGLIAGIDKKEQLKISFPHSSPVFFSLFFLLSYSLFFLYRYSSSYNSFPLELSSVFIDTPHTYRTIATNKVTEHSGRDADRSDKAKHEAQVYDEQIKQLSKTDLPGAHWSEKALTRILFPSSL
jgi:hypothetical protein